MAAEHGAVGCLIYSDPRDDGYFAGDVFPKGPMRPKDGVQRGSVMDMPVLEPGRSADAGRRRDDGGEAARASSEAPSLTKIPVLPISYGDAQPLLAALDGPAGARGLARRAADHRTTSGPGPAKVHLKVAFNWDIKPVYDVVARIPGAERPGRVGRPRQPPRRLGERRRGPGLRPRAPCSRRRARSGELLKQGWRPKRTIVYCAWDGEEPMLLGSTEWVEAHADELRQHAVAYINTDGNGRGYLEHGRLAHARALRERRRAGRRRTRRRRSSVWKRPQARASRRRRVRGGAEGAPRAAPTCGSTRWARARDYTPFLQHLGVAALNLGFGGEDDGGIYHSIYDDFYWYTHFSDTDFVYGRALAQTVGHGRPAPGRRRRCCPSSSPASPTRRRST